MSLPEAKLDALLARHADIERELAARTSPEAYVRLSREFAEHSPLIDKVKAYRAAAAELDDVAALIADPATDAEMRALATAEKPVLEARRAALEDDIRQALVPKDAM